MSEQSEEEVTHTKWEQFQISGDICDSLRAADYHIPTEVQEH
jgi:superfamily II DNA/RNA helicase